MVFNEAAVSLQDVAIRQSGRTILQNVSFNIDKGEFVYLVGRTGNGKTTLLKFLYADLAGFEGKARVAGFEMIPYNLKQVPDLRRKIGIIFQDFQLFFDRTIGDNLLFVMKATGWTDNAKMRKRLSEVLMQVGLSNVESKYPHQLSGGEQQRVTIARALINEPLILFADEPTGNLDPEVSLGIMRLFRDINRSGTAVFMATHNYDLVKAFPGRILHAQEGSIKEMELEGLQQLNPFSK